MTYKLFIDDERYPVSDDWIICRSSKAAISFVSSFGMPNEISFDHDLGGDDISIIFIKWMIDEILDGRLEVPSEFMYTVHSQNCVGAANIKSLLDSFLNFMKEPQ